jgi:RsiW-degrading membrane proteinase PrsW (M82 family)
MTEQSYPPPPPPTPVPRLGLHGPGTNFFRGLRARLSSLEKTPLPIIRNGLGRGLLVSFVLAAVVGFLLSFFLELPFIPLGAYPLAAVIGPFTEEPFKAVGMLIVAFFMWKAIPNRRYGAALGAAAGLGFAIAEDILYFSGFYAAGAGATAYLVRLLLLPFMHPTWSAFVGIGVFVFVAEKSKTGKVKWGLPLLFLFLGILNHMVWNSIAALAVVSPGLGYGLILVDVFVTFPIFALILRDFLGGHFNFQNFLESVPDTAQQLFPVGPPPPPPPT